VEALVSLAQDAGLTLIELAVAFVLEHPAVTATIIGPRTMSHLEDLLGTVRVRLNEAVLDGIDQIVSPGVTLNTEDLGWEAPSLAPANRRRSTSEG
jgi:aryl-alcohol dehydrogenase-like predicted oxidoreductase